MTSYGEAICKGFEYLLEKYPEVFVIGQGLWSPWYVGNSMTDLDVKFGKDRVLDSPVSENACTGAAIGASLCGYKPVVVHPRIDFMVLATDPIVNQAAKWAHMLGGQARPSVTIRGIINRGGEQGAQHSQALHSWYAHVPGLRVVMPATASDARDLLIASVLCEDPVVFIDDRWLYDLKDDLGPVIEQDLSQVGPKVRRAGSDVTLVGASYSAQLCELASVELAKQGISAEVIDLRVINPLNTDVIVSSVKKTGRLVAIDGSWGNCGLAGEVIASVFEKLGPDHFKCAPLRVTLPSAPAPTSKFLESEYYPTTDKIVAQIRQKFFSNRIEKTLFAEAVR
ncbi:MAG: alpha-ketoacid dehydrogenase subunit beta [Bdellovibrionales bacterium CG10_big_fil_rev_8_21_14_0_10_45_34]|nr:MAG: alpha-ketoacid dehydrogenase subunit beta [Bdellovibrionales bacterium CG10_big_fil_rev_8_21_14_0_10_45_34]